MHGPYNIKFESEGISDPGGLLRLVRGVERTTFAVFELKAGIRLATDWHWCCCVAQRGLKHGVWKLFTFRV
jgi:hypothetical protein